jgi:membrane-associated phospholipid phosphatase
LRPPPPPPRETATAEADELRALARGRDAATRDAIAYWDTGPPSYRWNELAVAEALAHHQYTHPAARGLALLHVALDDALVAAWDAKYAYRRPRPSDVHPGFPMAVAMPEGPSYPAEHAVAAGAASEILAYLYPERAEQYADRAQHAAWSRVRAGVNYACDVRVGLALGRVVARRVIARARADRSDQAWTGTAPTGVGTWSGADPVLPQAAGWQPWVLASPDELRSPPPPAHDTAEMAAEMD